MIPDWVRPWVRLLPQPRGFEGFCPRAEVGPPEAPPAPPAGHLPERLIDRRLAPGAVATNARGKRRANPSTSAGFRRGRDSRLPPRPFGGWPLRLRPSTPDRPPD